MNSPVCFNNAYAGRRVLITGHTGFKGSWLSLWLTQLGATLRGVSLNELPSPNHWKSLKLNFDSFFVDLRERKRLETIIKEFRPEVVFHLAAQPLVRRSYREPYETWSTNVIGTANLLEACRLGDELAAIVVVTTDKCYRNHESAHGYAEGDALGGHDPYSASKAATELLIASYRQSVYAGHPSALIATARAGNVIGGGDWAEDRLIPDAARAVQADQALEVRYPQAVRPWQHVLDSLSGYLLLGQRLLEKNAEFADAWNFGPANDEPQAVADVLNRLQFRWPSLRWRARLKNHTLMNQRPCYCAQPKRRSIFSGNQFGHFKKRLTIPPLGIMPSAIVNALFPGSN